MTDLILRAHPHGAGMGEGGSARALPSSTDKKREAVTNPKVWRRTNGISKTQRLSR